MLVELFDFLLMKDLHWSSLVKTEPKKPLHQCKSEGYRHHPSTYHHIPGGKSNGLSSSWDKRSQATANPDLGA